MSWILQIQSSKIKIISWILKYNHQKSKLFHGFCKYNHQKSKLFHGFCKCKNQHAAAKRRLRLRNGHVDANVRRSRIEGVGIETLQQNVVCVCATGTWMQTCAVVEVREVVLGFFVAFSFHFITSHTRTHVMSTKDTSLIASLVASCNEYSLEIR